MNTRRFLTLMQREWLQHRFGWILMATVPLGIALLLILFGQVRVETETLETAGDMLPAMLAAVSIAATTGVLFLIVTFSATIIVAGMARRDHADRSIEFWLSVPAGHAESLGAPLLVHLVLVPAAALLIGLLQGYLVSLVLVARVAGIGAWLALPWLDIVMASVSFTLRLLAGLPLMLLWLSPLILLMVLLTAWFKRWAWVILGVGVGLGSLLLKKLFGQPMLSDLLTTWLVQGGRALLHAGDGGLVAKDTNEGFEAIQRLPSWALHDYGLALRELPSPTLLLGLAVAALCFWLLVQWRQRGAGAAG